MTIKWSQIEAECGDYREGFVATFRKYEGQPTDEIGGNGHRVKVTIPSFGRHVGIPETTLRGWVEGATREVSPGERVEKDAKAARTRIKYLPPDRKAEIARELLEDEEVAQAVVEHPETMRNVNRAASRTTEGRDLTQRGKAHEARAEEHGPALTTPLAILPLFLEHATVLREAAERITVNGATDEALPMLAKLGEHLAATGRLFISAAEGATTKITDADLDAWLSGEAR
jgi:hypothetical protein